MKLKLLSKNKIILNELLITINRALLKPVKVKIYNLKYLFLTKVIPISS
jgi:hypothetical protein